MPTLVRQDIRITSSEFDFAPTLLPAVPTVTQTIDTYRVLGPDGAALIGLPGGTRQDVRTPTGATRTSYQQVLTALLAAVGPQIETVTIQNPDGSVHQTFDRVGLWAPITITPVFDPETHTLDVPNCKLRLRYRRLDASDNEFNGVEADERVIGPDGWNLNLTVARNLINAKRNAIKTREGM